MCNKFWLTGHQTGMSETKISVKNIEGGVHGSYNFRQTNFKDFSRIFQGQITVFKD